MNKKQRILLQFFLIVLVGDSTILLAQFDTFHESWRWTHFTTKTGLPSNVIEDIVETDNGTVWVLTPKGIAWYDGFRWNAIDSSRGLPEIQPNKIVAGNNGTMFAIMNRSLYKGDTSGFKPVFPNVDSLAGKIVSAEMFDTASLLFSTAQGPVYLMRGTEIVPYVIPGVTVVTNFWKLPSKSLWLSSDSGVVRYNNNHWVGTSPDLLARSIAENSSGDGIMSIEAPRTMIGIWEWSKNGPMRYSKTDRGLPIRSLDISRSGAAIAVYQSGEIRVRENGVWRFLQYASQYISNVQVVKFRANEDLWIGTETGLFLYRKTLPQWNILKYPFSDLRNIVMEVFQTSTGDLWIGSAGGITILPKNGKEHFITNVHGTKLGLITGINEAEDGAMWICSGATFSGAYRWDGKTWRHYGTAEGLTAPRIHKIRKDRKGNLWFLGLGDKFYEPETDPGAFVLSQGKFRSVSTKDGLLSNRVYAFAESKSGAMWFGTRFGLCRFRDGKWKSWRFPDFLSNFIYSIAVDDNERLWFSNFSAQLGVIETNDSVRWVLKNDFFGSRRIWDLQVDE
ncbi:MAG: two-component regulator propeller domain-containing protein, partial [Bacteroidota bacterium]